MKYADIVTGLGLLVQAQRFHRNAADRYAKLFNASFVGKWPTIPADRPYTPLQEFYQRMAQKHLCQYFYYQQQGVRYQEIVDVAALDTGDGLEPGETLLPSEPSPADDRRLKGL
jgi:hypothetical protein